MCATFIFLLNPWENNDEENRVVIILLSPETGIYVNKLTLKSIHKMLIKERDTNLSKKQIQISLQQRARSC